jgi:hypothetical protein
MKEKMRFFIFTFFIKLTNTPQLAVGSHISSTVKAMNAYEESPVNKKNKSDKDRHL